MRGADRAQSERDGVPPEPPGALWVRRTRAPANRPSRAPVANNWPPCPGRSGHFNPGRGIGRFRRRGGLLRHDPGAGSRVHRGRARRARGVAERRPQQCGPMADGERSPEARTSTGSGDRTAQGADVAGGTPRWQQARPGDECHRPTPTDRSATAFRMTLTVAGQGSHTVARADNAASPLARPRGRWPLSLTAPGVLSRSPGVEATTTARRRLSCIGRALRAWSLRRLPSHGGSSQRCQGTRLWRVGVRAASRREACFVALARLLRATSR